VAVSHDQADLTYVAYVSQFGTALPPPGIVATSNVVEVIWLSVSLNAAPAVMAPGDTTTLLALSALDLSNTRFSIEILDVSADVAVAVCGFDNACWTTVTQSQSTAHTYRALITSVGAGPSIVAASPDFAVSWLTVGLSASPTAPVAPPFTTTLTATATLDVGPTPWNIEIFDLTTSRLVTACGGGQVCTIDVALTDADVHRQRRVAIPHAAHLTLDQRTGGVRLLGGALEQQLVVDREYRPRPQSLSRQRGVAADHRELDDVGGGPLDDRVHG